MGKHNNGPVQDSPELMQRCLNCPYPPECCHGEKRCMAEARNDRKNVRDVIRYAAGKGLSNVKIADIVGETPNFVSHVRRHKYKEDKA